MNVRKLSFFLITIYAFLLVSCDENSVEVYNGPSQIHFTDTKANVIVDSSDPVFSVEVGVSKPVNYDRSFSVVIQENSTAVENVNFELLDNEVTILAGEVMANIQVKGLFANAEPEGVQLNLSLNSSNQNELAQFNNIYELSLFKFCDFDREAFVGTYNVFEHAFNGEFEYQVTITAGDDAYSVYVDGLWAVPGSAVQVVFNRNSTNCSMPDQFFFNEPANGYENAWIKSLSDGVYNSCLGSIEGIEYFVYPKDGEDGRGWDRGTFDMYKVSE